MHGGSVAKKLPARPDLDHLRRQAKVLLAQLNEGDTAAANTFITHLPEARTMRPAAVRKAGFRLADAQSAIARQSGFASWPALSRHVQELRALEGEWLFVSLEVDANAVPAAMLGSSRLLIDGDQFRMESPEANYDGIFTIDVESKPSHIDIEFVEGPEAGHWSYGIYQFKGDQLTICLGLTGAIRPCGFRTEAGSGHALERLRRSSSTRPANVTGGPAAKTIRKKAAASTSAPVAALIDPRTFDVPMTPLLQRLEGDWAAVELVMDGQPMVAEWLSFGSRTTVGNEVKVVFGGQTMLHAKVRIDDSSTPVAVDYLNLAGKAKGTVSLGIMDWLGADARFLMAAPGKPRPTDFTCERGSGCTLSRWKKK
jgi:uncharacterized protein (TIGR03067 family)